MDCSKTLWGDLLYFHSFKMTVLEDTEIPLIDLTDLSAFVEPLPTRSKIKVLVGECERRFPWLAEELAGKFAHTAETADDEPEADSTSSWHPRTPLQGRCQYHAFILVSMARLCLLQGIYPAIFFSEFLKHLREKGKRVRYGSGLFLESPGRLRCANVSPLDGKCCHKEAQIPCPRCELVGYCSAHCWKAHWDSGHKFHCARALMESATRNYEREKALADGGLIDRIAAAHSAPALIWDSIPAFGVLGAVGGTCLPNPFRILLMDTIDLNNLIETLHQLDVEYVGEVQIFVQTPAGQTLARNLILCSLLLRMASGELDDSAVDAVIAIWYSASLTSSQYLLLMESIVQLLNMTPTTGPSVSFPPPSSIFGLDRNIMDIQADMVKLTHKHDKDEISFGTTKQTVSSGSSLCVTTNGIVLYKYLTQMGLSNWKNRAVSRQAILALYDRRHGFDGFLLESHYTALETFGETGLLLPFAAQSYGNHHCLPNPTLVSAIDNPDVGWTALTGRLDPLCGWPIHHYMHQSSTANVFAITQHGVPHNDLYGKLFFHVRGRILSAVTKIKACKIAFHFSDQKSRVKCLSDLITAGPGTESIHIARIDFTLYEGLWQNSSSGSSPTSSSSSSPGSTSSYKISKIHSILENPLLHQVLVDGGAVIMLTKPTRSPRRNMTLARSKFRRFLSEFESDKFSSKLLELARGNEKGSCNIADLFLSQDAYVKEVMKELERLRDLWEVQTSPAAPVYRMPLSTAAPKRAEGSSSEEKAKMVGVDDESKEVWQELLSDVRTPEQCYMQVLLTCLDHNEVILELRKRPPSPSLIDKRWPGALDGARLEGGSPRLPGGTPFGSPT